MASAGERALAMEEIRNLVVQYPHTVDKGDFKGVGEFYDGTTTRAFQRDGTPLGPDTTRDAAGVEQFYNEIIEVDDEGFPNTQHLVSNIQVEVSDDAQTGTGKSTFTVFQGVGDFPLQAIITGFYHDKFEKDGGKWRLVEREEVMGIVGDLSKHLKLSLEASAEHH